MSRKWITAAFLVGWLGVTNALWGQSFYNPGAGTPPPPSTPNATAFGTNQSLEQPPEPPGRIPFTTPPTVNNAFSREDPQAPTTDDLLPPRLQFRAEYLVMWTKAFSPAIPLITRGDINDPVPGALDQPGTSVIFGQYGVGGQPSSGGRFSATYWLADPQQVGIEGNIWLMEQRSHIYAVQGSGDAATTAVYARPFFNPNTLTEDADPRVVPGFFAGSVQSTFMTRIMGAESNMRYNLDGGEFVPGFTLLLGARFLRLEEKYLSEDSAVNLPAGVGNAFRFEDNITTRNHFVGGQIGAAHKFVWQRLSLDTQMKVAIGPNFQGVHRSGFTEVTDQTGAGLPTVADNFALYVQPSNRGTISRSPVTLVPEASANLRLLVTDFLRLQIGYTFLYVNDVSRPDNQFDRVINIQPLNSPVQIGPARPTAVNNHGDFWVQWVNVGLEFIY